MAFRNWLNNGFDRGCRAISANSTAVVLISALCISGITSRPTTALGGRVLAAAQTTVTTAQLADSAPALAPSALKACLLTNGLAYGPFRDGQGPSDSLPFPASDQIEEDLSFIGNITKHIRVYGSSAKYAVIPSLAKRHGIAVMQGIHLSKDDKANEAEIDAALNLAHQGLIDSIIVGNETLTAASGNTTSTGARLQKRELIEYIRQVKKKLASSKIPVSSAQLYGDWESNLDLAQEVDFVVAHFYPFWDGKPVGGAAATVVDNYKTLKANLRAKYGHDVRVVIGETGWPSGGPPRGEAIPSPDNQRRFLSEFMAISCTNSIPFYYFEALDEEWKWPEGTKWEGSSLPLPEGDRTFSGRWIGSSWGIFQSNGRLKSQFRGMFDELAPGSRVNRDIFVEGSGVLSAYYDLGVDTFPDRRHDWLSADNGELKMSYPGSRDGGAVFVTVGTPTSPPRPWKDFSEFDTLSLEMGGESGGERLEIGIKNRADPNNGGETRIVETLPKGYRSYPYKFPLKKFASGHLRVPEGLRQLNVIVEFVFPGPRAETVYVKNIRYEAKQ